MIIVPVIFVIISYIIYKKCYKLTGEYYEKIMDVLKLRKSEAA